MRTPFHEAIDRYFDRALGRATAAQERAWPAIASGNHTLIAAPTGAGKTLAAFLSAIDALLRQGLEGGLADETHVLYVSPLKALSNDIERNLRGPLEGIGEELERLHLPAVPIRAVVRTGDTSPGERSKMRKRPPHILVTTPESLFIVLTSESGRAMLRTVSTVIVDEIHALAGNKRGAHLALSLERLEALVDRPPIRIGLSATQTPVETMARFLVGNRPDPCTIVELGHGRARDLAIEMPASPLEPVTAHEVWSEVYARLSGLVQAHRTTLIFVNTRRLAERVAAALAERLGEEAVAAHHGSLAREHRLDAERRLKAGDLRALVATASLELGIDIGEVDLVCQIGSSRSIATFLQRVGRSGHAIDGLPKGRIFPQTPDDLVECVALLQAVQRGELDRIRFCERPLDVLAQQVVAEVAGSDWNEQALYEHFRLAWPYRELSRESFSDVVQMLSDGFHTRRGRRSAYLHRDAVHGDLRGRKGARLAALTNAGAIPEYFDYDVILSPEGVYIGSLNEDFAFESMPGDIFQLGNASYRILKIESGRVFAADAKGQPPNIPFWLGEAPGRSDELSLAVSRLRSEVGEALVEGLDAASHRLQSDLGLNTVAAEQVVEHLAAAKAALGALPTRERIVLERFFDDVGDMHLIVHSPFGARINRAWGLSLRKRFCRKFNFELQAAATDDAILLSLGRTHSFLLEEVAGYLRSATVRELLVQALLAAPMFPTRWRWVATTSLAVPRMRGGKRAPAFFQRNDAEDLVALIFPDQLACFENLAGDREIPDHPLVEQAVNDCLHELMDIAGLEALLEAIEAGEVAVVARDLTAPSPLAAAVLEARPFAFLDDAPAEERRALAVQRRRLLDPAAAADLGRLDLEAIEAVRAQAWPEATTEDELHDALFVAGFMTQAELAAAGVAPGSKASASDSLWAELMLALSAAGRVTCLKAPHGEDLWVTAERLAELMLLFEGAIVQPPIEPLRRSNVSDVATALRELLRSRLDVLGPVTARTLVAPLACSEAQASSTLASLEQEGYVIQGHFIPGVDETQWCERALLARIHRRTLKRLRAEIAPVPPAAFMHFLFHWQGLLDRPSGDAALVATIGQLEGCSLPAAAWEEVVLPSRIADFSPTSLDALCRAGRVTWMRLPSGLSMEGMRRSSPVGVTPIALLPREASSLWRSLASALDPRDIELSSDARRAFEALEHEGALFVSDLAVAAGLLRTQLEAALGELVSWGLVTSDGFAGLRALMAPQHLRPSAHARRRRNRTVAAAIEDAGRWSRLRDAARIEGVDSATVESIAATLLRRYGVVFRRLLEREVGLPPWRELLYVYRRLEARGEVRGGRFVTGFSGEQFALPEAVATLRRLRKEHDEEALVSISAADPLNLTGIVTPLDRVPARTGNRLLYRRGVPIAVYVAGEVSFLARASTDEEWRARKLLLRKGGPPRTSASSALLR